MVIEELPIQSVAVLMTSFNRRELTMKSLELLFKQRHAATMEFAVFLVDDGSTDGTGDAVRSGFPQAHILQGNGTLFWNGGMRMAFAAAMREGYDAYILLNDDTHLYEDALARVVACARERMAAGRPTIVVGSTRSPITGERTYGGLVKRTSGLRMWLEAVKPDAEKAIPCDTMNGNFTLIPAAVADEVGNLEGRFRHQFGDLDYGLRAKRAGFDVVVAPGYVGECATNGSAGTFRDSCAPLAKRWKSLTSPKGVPVWEWLLFTWRHFGWRWPHYAASPYLKAIASSVKIKKSV
jgi:GT2 family glycosyltransferase